MYHYLSNVSTINVYVGRKLEFRNKNGKFRIAYIRFGCNTLFTACEWNSSFIIAEAGTIPQGRAEGNNLCRGLN